MINGENLMKKIAILLLIVGVVFISISQKAVSRQERYNVCRNGEGEASRMGGWICETDGKVCYIYSNAHSSQLLYCENK